MTKSEFITALLFVLVIFGAFFLTFAIEGKSEKEKLNYKVLGHFEGSIMNSDGGCEIDVYTVGAYTLFVDRNNNNITVK